MDYIESVIYKKTLSFISSVILDAASATPAGAVSTVGGTRHVSDDQAGFSTAGAMVPRFQAGGSQKNRGNK
jgi:hypothetical protein